MRFLKEFHQGSLSESISELKKTSNHEKDINSMLKQQQKVVLIIILFYSSEYH